MTTDAIVTLERVQQVLSDLGQLAACDTPAIGGLPVRTEKIAQAITWLWDVTGVDAADLRAARRAFSKRHHPDVAPAAARDQATGKIAVANRLIDDALREATPWQT